MNLGSNPNLLSNCWIYEGRISLEPDCVFDDVIVIVISSTRDRENKLQFAVVLITSHFHFVCLVLKWRRENELYSSQIHISQNTHFVFVWKNAEITRVMKGKKEDKKRMTMMTGCWCWIRTTKWWKLWWEVDVGVCVCWSLKSLKFEVRKDSNHYNLDVDDDDEDGDDWWNDDDTGREEERERERCGKRQQQIDIQVIITDEWRWGGSGRRRWGNELEEGWTRLRSSSSGNQGKNSVKTGKRRWKEEESLRTNWLSDSDHESVQGWDTFERQNQERMKE